MVPATSYNRSVGAPLPEEFESHNYSLRVAFQGGDYQFWVGAFSIEKHTDRNETG
jgi:hypothetical protein